MIISTSKKIRTGIFVLVTLCLFLILIFLIGKQRNMFADTFSVNANFKNISGIKEGNYVRFAGINVGNVEYINILNDTTVQISLTLRKKIQRYIKEDATASIGSDGLMGDKLILIAPGSDSAALVKNGGTLRSTNPMDMDKVMKNFSKISENAEALTSGLAGVVNKINKGEGSLGRLLTNDNLAKKMEGAISSTQETVKSIKTTANKVSENMEAAKHNILLRGYFRKKEKKRLKDSIENAKNEPVSKPKKE